MAMSTELSQPVSSKHRSTFVWTASLHPDCLRFGRCAISLPMYYHCWPPPAGCGFLPVLKCTSVVWWRLTAYAPVLWKPTSAISIAGRRSVWLWEAWHFVPPTIAACYSPVRKRKLECARNLNEPNTLERFSMFSVGESTLAWVRRPNQTWFLTIFAMQSSFVHKMVRHPHA